MISRELKHNLINKLCARGGWATRIMRGLTEDDPLIKKKALNDLGWIMKSSEEAIRILIDAEEVNNGI